MKSSSRPRHSLLTAGLLAACGLATAAAPHVAKHAETLGSELKRVVPTYLRVEVAKAEVANPYHPATGTDHYVTSCADDGSPGTLRSVIENANTVSGDSINLTQLLMTCSKISLGTTAGISGAIHVSQYELHIHGPGADQLAIDGNFDASVLYHSGTGTLGISNVTIANGYYIGSSHPYGGCISSNGSVLLISSKVSDCTVRNSNTRPALGGAIYTRGYLTLFDSVISDGHAYTQTAGQARGGGAYVKGDFTSAYSIVSDNVALPILSGVGDGVGAGVFARGNVDIEGSTVARNEAQFFAGLELFGFGAANVVNSTISDNIALISGGGIFSTIPLVIANSTVAFNTSQSAGLGYSTGVHVLGTLTLQSSIIADNKGPNGQDDLDGSSGTIVMGSSNLVTSWNFVNVDIPAGTLTNCPKLDPLADNGSSTTLTHKLRHDSPAIDQGDPGSLISDQRGDLRVYPANGMADIGAVEWQPTDHDERILASGFDGVCDW